MTPLPAFSEQVVERRDLPEYEIEPRCANPRCPNRAEHPHEIRPRSQTAGMVWWVEIPGRFLIGNRVGLCAGCHRRTDDHSAAIIWDDVELELAWCDITEDWAEALKPAPPVHTVQGLVKQPDRELIPSLPEIVQSSIVGEDEFMPRLKAEPQPDDMQTLGVAMGNMERFLEAQGEIVPDRRSPAEAALGIEPEPGVPTVQPNELLAEEPPEDGGSARGDDQETVERARQATEEAQQRAVDVTGMGEFQPDANVVPWVAEIIVYADEDRIEVLEGDLRVGKFVEEQIEKAKRAPKPREPKPDPPDGEPEPAKARRTWSISVPSEERTDERVSAGEDGYQLIEEALDNLRQRMKGGRDEFPGWKYYVLMDALGWMLLNYTEEGED